MESRSKVLLIIIAILSLVAIGALIYVGGTKGLYGVFDMFLTVGFWVLVIVFIFAIAYFLLIYEKKINASLEVYKDIKRESNINRLDNLGNLFLTGNSSFSRPIEIGKITGFSSRKTYQKDAVETKEATFSVFQNETIFLVKKKSRGFLDSVIKFFSKKIIVRVPSSLHSVLHGDVFIKCNSLVKHLYYFYPDVVHLDVKTIDSTLYYEGERYIQLNFISKIDPLLSRAVGVRQEDLKKLEGKTGLDMLREKQGSVVGNQQQAQPVYYQQR